MVKINPGFSKESASQIKIQSNVPVIKISQILVTVFSSNPVIGFQFTKKFLFLAPQLCLSVLPTYWFLLSSTLQTTYFGMISLGRSGNSRQFGGEPQREDTSTTLGAAQSLGSQPTFIIQNFTGIGLYP
jgi:hypothetical protein